MSKDQRIRFPIEACRRPTDDFRLVELRSTNRQFEKAKCDVMKIMFAAGGTGGHVNPALSVAQEIRERFPEAEILFVGTKDKLEATLVPKAGFDFAPIDITGFQRSLAPADLLYNLGTLRRLLFVTGQCKKILRRFQPQIAVGFGGYVSGPVLRTAHQMGVKTAIHEQNAFPGKTNIALSRYADSVMLTYPGAADKLKSAREPVLTGLPVRSEILTADREEARQRLGFPEEKLVILSTGGSLGAEALNRVMCQLIPACAGREFVFVHGCGQQGSWVPEKLRENGLDPDKTPGVTVTEYIYDMASYMAAADLVITRAGAGTLAELQALGKASVMIPYPYAAENHQYHNARALADNGAGIVIEQKDLTAERLREILEDLSAHPEKYRRMGQNARLMAKCDAKKQIADIVLGLL